MRVCSSSILVACCLARPLGTTGFVVPNRPHNAIVDSSKNVKESNPRESSMLFMATPETKKQKKIVEVEEDDGPAGIGGAEFFGGNKQKEEFYDEDAEAQAAKLDDDDVSDSVARFVVLQKNDGTLVPSPAFDTLETAQLAASLQSQINHALYVGMPPPDKKYTYAESNNLQWTTPFPQQKGKTPFQELETALEFYQQLDMAIVSGKKVSSTSGSADRFELSWEISVVWPTFWAPRVLLLGTSQVKVDATSNKIVSQSDALLGGAELLTTVASQIKPRFWDWYHIGMTPSAELMPRLNVQKKNSYQVFDLPARWVSQPTMLEVGDREDRNAQVIPNHSFSCIIKTMGPNRQRYVPTSPVQVQIKSSPSSPASDDDDSNSNRLLLEWSIPLAVDFVATNAELPLPGTDPEALEGSSPQCTYQFQPLRRVATVPFGGSAQDTEISAVRKRLYDQVLKDGIGKPKLDQQGRPQFFFWQNIAKACFTANQGLGMCVYEWQPAWAKPNEVGIELEV